MARQIDTDWNPMPTAVSLAGSGASHSGPGELVESGFQNSGRSAPLPVLRTSLASTRLSSSQLKVAGQFHTSAPAGTISTWAR